MSDEKDDKWEMPEPVFRTSSGALPKRFEDTISHSFAPDVQSVKLEEDADILGIMNSNDGIGSSQNQESEELDPEAILETVSAHDMPAMPTTVEYEPAARSDQPPPISMADTDSIEEPTQIDGRRADLWTFLFVFLLGAFLLVTAVYYLVWPPTPVR